MGQMNEEKLVVFWKEMWGIVWSFIFGTEAFVPPGAPDLHRV
jgi:hypothetical protein